LFYISIYSLSLSCLIGSQPIVITCPWNSLPVIGKLFAAKPDLKSFNVNGAEEKSVLPGYDGKSRSEIQVKIM